MRTFRKRLLWVERLSANEEQLKSVLLRLERIKTDLINLKTIIDNDPNATQEDKATMAQIENIVTSNEWTKFIDFLNRVL